MDYELQAGEAEFCADGPHPCHPQPYRRAHVLSGADREGTGHESGAGRSSGPVGADPGRRTAGPAVPLRRKERAAGAEPGYEPDGYHRTPRPWPGSTLPIPWRCSGGRICGARRSWMWACGAGFPGVPLAIAVPEARITLLDSLQKRINWLKTVLPPAGGPGGLRRRPG